MRLKKLKISGFKSFADKIVLDFDCEKIAIVGPNGCGKSNIVDAIRWVLGEQSAKSLRGEKMHDILFAGSASRKPLNVAEVSLTLTDIDGKLPLEYEEVVVTRRLYRKGESEYLINNQQARLRDLNDLFLGSGIGKNAFSIFEQGKLDQVINTSPQERRALFEETSGISRFLLRKKETVKKLNEVSENYQRANDLYQEVESQATQLKRQASLAKNYQKNRDRLSILEKGLLATRWKVFSEKSDEIETTLHSVQEAIKQAHNQTVASEEELEKSKRLYASLQEKTREKEKILHEIETQIRVKKAQKEHLQRRLEEIKKERLSLTEEGNSLRDVVKKLSMEKGRKEEELATLENEKSTLEKVLQDAQASYNEEKKEQNALREKWKNSNAKYVELLQLESSLSRKLQEEKSRIESQNQSLETLVAEKEELQKELMEKKEEERGHREKFSSLTQEVEKRGSKVEAQEKEFLAIREKRKESQSALQHIEKKQSEKRAREKVLAHLKEEYEGFSMGAKKLLQASKDQKHPLYQKLSPLFAALQKEVGYAELLAVALTSYRDTLLVESEEDLHQVLDFAFIEKLTGFSLLCQEAISSSNGKADSAHLTSRPIGEHLLEGIKIVENLPTPLQKNLLTKGGIWVNEKGVVSLPSSGKGQNTFLRDQELKNLSKELSQLEKEKKEVENRSHTLQAEEEEKERSRNVAAMYRQSQEMNLVQENFHLQQALSTIEKISTKLKSLEMREEKLLETARKSDANASLAKKLAEVITEKERLQLLSQEEEKEYAAKEQQIQKSFSFWQEREAKFRDCERRWGLAQKELALILTREEQTQERLHACERKLAQLGGNLENLKKDLERDATIPEERQIPLRKELASLEKEGKLLFSLLKEKEKQLVERQKHLQVLEKERVRYEISLASERVEKTSLEHELQERFSLKPHEIAPLATPFEEAEKEIRHLQVAIEKAGAVNLAAIEQYQEQESRSQSLLEQIEDLKQAKNDLETGINALQKESRKRFRETFFRIQKNFQRNFQILFEGGEADLQLTDSNDILEAGVEIIAKPPGKQMRSISLLSGGEKCLTALALLFSFFEEKPAPFCLLDEVDAPLDETNIGRFTSILSQYTSSTQFILITHNKKTMTMADRLIGVSMEEKGVSKLLSLSFEKQNKVEVAV
ncbi:MAG: Chromosome partition protein Smc [Chlamydiae bacterium]|nr:Chromosome partition protein Smc [Chlamydiota bacterium]